jgi:predicted GIY-YIG superfamily endonuclease
VPSTETQLRLFADARPLLERFGAEFFRALPRRPGVYLMAGEADRVLYIGKAKNLRQRLSSYKYARGSRKLARLTASVRTISWEICDDPLAASLRENELLRIHKPKFNVVNTRSEHYPFIALRTGVKSVPIWLTRSPGTLPGVCHFGAFKGLPLVRSAFSALLRLLWRAEHPERSIYDLPLRLLGNPTTAAVSRSWEALLLEFLSGQNEGLIEQLGRTFRREGRFEEAFYMHDVELLREFFARGPQRNAHLRQVFCLYGPCIAQSELDDLIVLREQYAENM